LTVEVPDWEAAGPRLVALRRLRVKNLPTPRLILWTCFPGVLMAAFGVALLIAGGDAVWAVIGILLAAGGVLSLLLAWERWRAMRHGTLGRGRLERFFDHQTTEKVDASSAVLIDALLRAPELAESMAELAGDAAERVFSPRRRRKLEEFNTAIAKDLLPEEKPLVVVQASKVPHGMARALGWITFGVALLFSVKGGVLTVTDRRLLFHTYRWKKASLLMAEPLSGLSIVDWYKGIGASERWHSVLIVKLGEGSIGRFQIHRFWRSEGRTAFELLASISRDPPTALVNYWRAELAKAS
jgi:hypothetical protein